MATIILKAHSNFTLTLPEVALREIFPESILTASLDYPGPIILENPIVTVELL